MNQLNALSNRVEYCDMGHKTIMHTVRYTEMAPDRFKDFWKD